MATVGIIGGSGLYQIEGIAKVKEVAVKTPFGAPSDKFITGELEGIPVVFLAAPWPGASHQPFRDQLPRQYLRHEKIRGAGDHVCFRLRQSQGRI